MFIYLVNITESKYIYNAQKLKIVLHFKDIKFDKYHKIPGQYKLQEPLQEHDWSVQADSFVWGERTRV